MFFTFSNLFILQTENLFVCFLDLNGTITAYIYIYNF